jgi:hypothetical protein
MYQLKNKPQAEMTATPEKYPQGFFKEKKCRHCGTEFKPQAPSHLYCSQECADHALSSNYLKRTYGITLEHYQQLLEEQDAKCKICDSEGFVMNKDRHKVKLVVDHDHLTGKVRGLLCHNCNRALGLFKDNPRIIESAVNYLESE